MGKGYDFYARLGLPIDATLEEIRSAYRELARRFHPDINEAPGETEFFLGVQEAYEVLADPRRRSVYDSNIPPELQALPELSIKSQYSRSIIPRIQEPQLIYVLLDLEARVEAQYTSFPPINICLIVDCSTSMQGTVMDTVKSTAIELVRQMREQDILSVVSFSDKAEVVVPAINVIDRNHIETSIRMLQTQGGTEIYQGLEAGFLEVLRYRRSDYVNHIVLLTDGRTYGDEAGCLRIAEQANDNRIGISALGIGNKWNDVFLDTLASRTGGSSMFISMPRDIRPFLKQKFSGLIKSYADRVSYNFETGPGVALKYAIRLQPEASPLELSSPIQLGSIQCGGSLSVLLEFEIQPLAPGLEQLGLTEGLLTLEIPSRQVPTFTTRLKTEISIGELPEQERIPLKVLQAVSRLTLYRMQERAQEDIASGNIQQASRRLQHLATHLISRGEQELARTVMKEATNINENQDLSEEGKKRIKYGTRALLLPAPLRSSSSENGFQTPEGDGI